MQRALFALQKNFLLEIKKHIQEEIMQYWEPSISIGVAEIDATCQTSSEVLNRS